MFKGKITCAPYTCGLNGEGSFLVHVTTVLIRKVCKKVCNIPVYFLYCVCHLPSPQFITLRLLDLRNIKQLVYIDQVCGEHEVT